MGPNGISPIPSFLCGAAFVHLDGFMLFPKSKIQENQRLFPPLPLPSLATVKLPPPSIHYPSNVPKHTTEMRSIYSDRKKQKLKEQKERFHFKKHGYDGLTPRSRANHEARVIKQYGRTTKQMSNNVNARSRQWVNAVGDTLLRQTSGVQPVHRALVPFRSKFNPFESKVKHDKWHISVAKDNLLPRKHLRGGGLLDVEKSRILSESLSNSAVRLTQQKPVRLVQPKYRQPVRHCHALVRSLSICLVWLLEFLFDLCTMLPHSLLTFFLFFFLALVARFPHPPFHFAPHDDRNTRYENVTPPEMWVHRVGRLVAWCIKISVIKKE